MKHVLIGLIKIYQRIPGPWHNCCKYQPSCSNYAIGAINEWGCFKGVVLTTKRLLRCNPWNKGGYDPVPLRKKR